jgi:hypothetical protein
MTVNFYIVKILNGGGAVLPSTTIYGEVEIRPASADDKRERDAILQSTATARIKVEHEIASRIATVVQAASLAEAMLLADERFVPILDLLSVDFPLSEFSLTQYGYVKNLDSGDITPIQSQGFGPSLTFVVPRGPIKKSEFNQWFLRQSSDLAERYKRSIHWTRSAKWEESIQMAILYRWFSIEALFKQDEGDDITSLLLLFLGFPGGTYSKHISRGLLSRLAQNSEWTKWKKLSKDIVDKIRVFRNDSVHAGFRSVDYTPHELRLYHQIMTFGASRCQGAVKMALQSKIETVLDFKYYAGIIFEGHGRVENDILHNIIFSLENDTFPGTSRIHI